MPMALLAPPMLHCFFPGSRPFLSFLVPSQLRSPCIHQKVPPLSCQQQQELQDDPVQNKYERLFSNLNEVNLKHEPGSVSSAALLIAGTTVTFLLFFFNLTFAPQKVGAGILALPAVTQEAGFLASSITCLLCWSYMVGTGLLVAEVNINTMCELGSGGVSLVSMAQRTLGARGVQTACVAYLFIHYALLVAYVARSADIVSNAFNVPLWAGAVLFTGAFGGLCFFGSQRAIGMINSALVFGVIISFALLGGVAAGGLQLQSLLQINFAAVPKSVPVIALSFVYQNVVPVVCTNLEGDPKKIRSAIVMGTSIPLIMFLTWDAIILGSISGASGSHGTFTDPLFELRSSNGLISVLIETFSFLAISTSYIGFALGLSDFLSDLLKLPVGARRQPIPYMLTLVPPLALALLSPDIFYQALDFAGTYGVLLLFGILPAAMAWAERYSDVCFPPSTPPLVPGGRFTLSLILGFAGIIITTEFLRDILHN